MLLFLALVCDNVVNVRLSECCWVLDCCLTHWVTHWHTSLTHWHTDTLAHCDTLGLHAAWVTLVSPITVWVSSIDPGKTKKTKLGPKSRKNMKCWVEAKPGNYIWWPAAGFVGNKGDSRSQLLLKVWDKDKKQRKIERQWKTHCESSHYSCAANVYFYDRLANLKSSNTTSSTSFFATVEW